MSRSENGVSLSKSLFSAAFLFSAAVLGVAAVGLRPGVEALSKHYAKELIPVRKPLSEFDTSRLPSFATGWTREDIPPEEIETDEFVIFRLTRWQIAEGPKEVVLFVTYYSDPKGRVPHTPDVCYRQAGAILKEMKNVVIDVPGLARGREVKARLLLLEQQTYNQVVVFCFYADGRFRHSREQVRWLIGKPGNRHVYFSKIETVTSYPKNASPDSAIELCNTLFRESVPLLIAEHFPTVEQLRR